MASDTVTFCLFLSVSLLLLTNSQANAQDNNSTLKCGGVLVGGWEETFHVSYNMNNETIFSNRRCVWTLKSRGSSSFSVQVHSMGYEQPSDDHRIILTSFEPYDPISHFTVIDSLETIEMVGSVLVITFQTTDPDTSARGFNLTIVPGHNGHWGASDESQHYVMASNVGGVKHPPQLGRFPTSDVSTFIVVPEGNSFYRGRIINIVIGNSGMSSFNDCSDFIDVYKFNVSSEQPHKWDEWGRLCKANLLEIITSNDMLMVVFRSDLSYLEEEERGFTLAYNQC